MPQLFVASGWSGWGRPFRQYPWTMGFIPTYTAEGKIYARQILKTRKNSRIAVLYQDDEYGRELLDALPARVSVGERARSWRLQATTRPSRRFSEVTRLASRPTRTP